MKKKTNPNIRIHPNSPNNNMANLILKELSYKIVGFLYKVHRQIGRYCREKQYGDLFEELLQKEGIKFEREYPIKLADKKSNFVDFYIEDCLLVELKSKPFITKDDYYQMRRYLETIKKELGLIVNFRSQYLKPKRVLNSKMKKLRSSDPNLRITSELSE